MRGKKWTDEEVENEIRRLRNSEDVKLARKEQNIKNQRRNLMWNLQSLEKRGEKLREMGITEDNIKDRLIGEDLEDRYE